MQVLQIIQGHAASVCYSKRQALLLFSFHLYRRKQKYLISISHGNYFGRTKLSWTIIIHESWGHTQGVYSKILKKKRRNRSIPNRKLGHSLGLYPTLPAWQYSSGFSRFGLVGLQVWSRILGRRNVVINGCGDQCSSSLSSIESPNKESKSIILDSFVLPVWGL